MITVSGKLFTLDVSTVIAIGLSPIPMTPTLVGTLFRLNTVKFIRRKIERTNLPPYLLKEYFI
jgi:glycerol-3-phosphate O-acyltransferase